MFAKLGTSSQTGSSDISRKPEPSLLSVLKTPALRVEFVTLVAVCSDAMRRDLVSTFTSDLDIGPNSPTLASSISPVDVIYPSERQSRHNSTSAKEGRKELTSPQLRPLKRAALAFFDGWQVKVLRRLGETLNVKSEAVRNARTQAAAYVAEAKRQQTGLVENVQEGDTEHDEHALPIQTTFTEFDESKRNFLLNCLLMLLLSLGTYPAHSRILLSRFSACLELPITALAANETAVALRLLDTTAKQMSANAKGQRHTQENASSRRWKVGLTTVGGAALIGITGGSAAPLLVAGVVGVMAALGLGAVASLLGAVANSSVLLGGLFRAYGGRMTGKVISRYAKEVEDFKFIPLRDTLGEESDDFVTDPSASDGLNLQENGERQRHRLRVAIGISGWMASESDVSFPWHALSSETIEPFALKWEVSTLLRLGTSLHLAMQNYLVDGVPYVTLRQTVLSTLVTGLWPLALLKVAKVAENPFSVAMARADKAGHVLAEALMAKVQGERPITLIGFSAGARVIWSCLQALAERNAFGLVENIVLMGAPVPADSSDWRRVRAVVVGRVINVFSRDDWILGVLYRTSAVQLGVAGLQKVEAVPGLQNHDASDIVESHILYRFAVGQILEKVGFEDLDVDVVNRKRLSLVELEEEEAKVKREWQSTSEEVNNIECSSRDDPGSVELVKNDEGVAFHTRQRYIRTCPVEHDSDSNSGWGDDWKVTMMDHEPVPEPDPGGGW